MKVTEPVSLALLLTASAYSSGISQNNAFLREFNLSPEFTQQPVEKTLYDGGIILYELIFTYAQNLASFLSNHPTSLLATLLIVALALHIVSKNIAGRIVTALTDTVGACGSIIAILALAFLSIKSFDKGQIDGKKVAAVFINNCYEIKIVSEKQTSTGCAFRKDKDSIWYYSNSDFKIFSEPLTEKLKIEYLKAVPRKSDGKITAPAP